MYKLFIGYLLSLIFIQTPAFAQGGKEITVLQKVPVRLIVDRTLGEVTGIHGHDLSFFVPKEGLESGVVQVSQSDIEPAMGDVESPVVKVYVSRTPVNGFKFVPQMDVKHGHTKIHHHKGKIVYQDSGQEIPCADISGAGRSNPEVQISDRCNLHYKLNLPCKIGPDAEVRHDCTADVVIRING